MKKIRYFLDDEAYEYLTTWSEDYRKTIWHTAAFAKKSEVVLTKDYGINFRFYVETKPYGFKYNLLDAEGICAKGTISNKEDCENDFFITFDLSKRVLSYQSEKINEYVHILQVYCTAFLTANLFMFYGNLVDNKEYIAAGQNNDETKIITFRKYKDSVYAIPVGNHRSPEGVFQVRGHLRKYSDGKIIWIDSYLKGIK